MGWIYVEDLAKRWIEIKRDSMHDDRIMTISRGQLQLAKTENLEHLVKFVKMPVNSTWDHKTLANELFWAINPIPLARMY